MKDTYPELQLGGLWVKHWSNGTFCRKKVQHCWESVLPKFDRPQVACWRMFDDVVRFRVKIDFSQTFVATKTKYMESSQAKYYYYYLYERILIR